MGRATDVTALLAAWADGDARAGDALLPLIYDELKRLSRAQLARGGGPLTLQATELLNEAYLRLADQRDTQWQNRAHFFALASTVIRRVLLDHARRRSAARRDRRLDVPLEDEPALMSPSRAEEVLQLDDALAALAAVDARQAEVVQLRYFGGLTIDEIASVHKTSPATVKRDWTLARAWLYRRLNAASAEPDDG